MTRYIAMLVAILLPGAAFAQGTTQTWAGLDKAELSMVYVIDDRGVETSGRLLRIDPDALVLVVGDTERRFEAARVRLVEKRGDSLRNGAIIGAVVGGALGALGMALADCSGSNPTGPCPGWKAAGVVISTGFYSAIGVGIDALVTGRTTLYRAPAAPRRAALTPQRGRVAVSWGFSW
jgi:hypothetical protein